MNWKSLEEIDQELASLLALTENSGGFGDPFAKEEHERKIQFLLAIRQQEVMKNVQEALPNNSQYSTEIIENTTHKLTLIKKIKEGAFAEIWLGKDELRDNLAVKLVKKQTYVTDTYKFILHHARKLSREVHPNLVTIFYTTKVKSPNNPIELIDAICMEFINGITLHEKLQTKINITDSRKIGLSIIDGLKALHNQNIAHCDFHSKNVMCGDRLTKIIDVFSDQSTAKIDGDTLSSDKAKDIRDLKYLIHEIVEKTVDIDFQIAKEFSWELNKCDTFESIELIFNELFEGKTSSQLGSPLLQESKLNLPSGPKLELTDTNPRLKFSFSTKRDFIVIEPKLLNIGNDNASKINFKCKVAGPFRAVDSKYVYSNYPIYEERGFGEQRIKDESTGSTIYWTSNSTEPLRPDFEAHQVGLMAFNRLNDGDEPLELNFTFYADEITAIGQNYQLIIPASLIPTKYSIDNPKYKIRNAGGSISTASNSEKAYKIDAGEVFHTSDENFKSQFNDKNRWEITPLYE